MSILFLKKASVKKIKDDILNFRLKEVYKIGSPESCTSRRLS